MDSLTILMALCVLSGIWNVVISLIIFESLRKRGISVNFLLLRLMAPKYAFQYREVSRIETGRVGHLFYQWIISINLALVFFLIALILNI